MNALTFTQGKPSCYIRNFSRLFSSNIESESTRGVFVFVRHGDRTPCRPLCSEQKKEDEKTLWKTKLPSKEIVAEVSSRFPVSFHSEAPKNYIDTGRYPFGHLTHTGALQMREQGKLIKLRYNGCNDDDFLDNWNLKIYSTRYLRTVTSAQFFLDGLMPSNLKGATIPVQVRAPSNDPLNSFDRDPLRMSNIISSILSDPSFVETDSRALVLSERLLKYLPEIKATSKSSFGGPSLINWISAADHFVCRESHKIPLSSLQNPNTNDEVNMRNMASPTKAHRAWRFQQWFKCPSLLSAIVSPPLREIESKMRITEKQSCDNRRPFRIYSCHDVTLLSLLYGLDANFLQGDETFWPPYASTLVFELVDIKDENMIRIYFNGKEINTVPMKFNRFTRLVENLEDEGSWNDDSPAKESVMSNWTG